MKLINVGFGNLVAAERIVSIAGFDTQPVKRLAQDAKAEGRLVDTTYGRKTKAIILTDSGYVIASALQPETIAGRISGTDVRKEDET
ncbi:MAG TPA: DUF370 domain-containing protein [Oscillospiraceae bacterium]|nr:DUF370 domain-containing protein [Oscillospiraceae bacterium]HPS35319.1 DUF370 domain-containing protein [Oscillospiraceae bacterium]